MRKLSNPTARAERRYSIQMLAAFAVYAILLVGGIMAVQRLHLHGNVRYVLLLIPLVPVFAMVPAVLQYFRDSDEFDRQLTTESLAIAAGVTAVYAVTCGFLELAGMPKISAWYTWTVVMGTWALTRVFLRWRYR
jgi:hypothetical protein